MLFSASYLFSSFCFSSGWGGHRAVQFIVVSIHRPRRRWRTSGHSVIGLRYATGTVAWSSQRCITSLSLSVADAGFALRAVGHFSRLQIWQDEASIGKPSLPSGASLRN